MTSKDLVGEIPTYRRLLPCPFCGGKDFSIRENGRMWGGQGYTEAVSVSVWHWCEPVPGEPARAIERVGRDLESAIIAWNRRVKVDE